MSISRWVLVIGGAIVAGIFELSFASFFQEPFRSIHPILDLVVLAVVLARPRHAMIFAVVAGLVLDLFPVDGSTASALRFLVITTIVMGISQTVLTNRSVYATGLLVIAARGMDILWLRVAGFISGQLFSRSLPSVSFVSLGWTLLWDIAIVSTMFVIVAVFTRRFMISAPAHQHRYDA